MKSAALQLHSLNTQTVFLFLVMLLLTFSSALGANETDLLALRAIKSKIIYDPKGVLRMWNDSFHHCKWEGVTCGHRHKRVTFLDLSSRGLVGSLSPYIGNLSFLREILLYNNTLEGEIPPEVGRLFRLQRLSLLNNSINGKIPANLSQCFQFTHLSIGNNMLVGEIPNQLSSLLKLKYLVIQNNRLTGQIPSFFGNFSSLETISGTYNHLSGAIPDSFGRLNNLSILLFGGNNLSEYGLGSEVSKNGDMYSYGILLLEMMTGKRPTDPIFEGSRNLHNFARTASPDHLMEMAAESVLLNRNEYAENINNSNQVRDGRSKKDCFISVIKIGVACSMESPHDRMDIVNVIRELHSVHTIFSTIQTSSEGPRA